MSLEIKKVTKHIFSFSNGDDYLYTIDYRKVTAIDNVGNSIALMGSFLYVDILFMDQMKDHFENYHKSLDAKQSYQ